MVSYLACVKTNMEAHEMIQNCELVYSINREKIYVPIFAVRICLEYSGQNKYLFQMKWFCEWPWLYYSGKMIVLKFLKLIASWLV